MAYQPHFDKPPVVRIVSFGYLHSTPPAADLVVDVRQLLRDPARARDGGLLDLDGLNPLVRDAVMTTPGALHLADGVFTAAFHLHTLARKPVTVAFGCAGGRHRSVALAEHVAALLRTDPTSDTAIPVSVRHLHVHLPRVLDGDQR
ncbi:UPF0042 nucleotide-binding protein [Actinokineospora terrae]|uniref:UPF0042 nucleotide-binding protein n=2 Tax=Actinokineospora terrae TaxID=155974 RepID=A0A1H9VHP0_9PSEU|nr:UPF0042 nucleotide-binding protein [Actinokineospora terrae]